VSPARHSCVCKRGDSVGLLEIVPRRRRGGGWCMDGLPWRLRWEAERDYISARTAVLGLLGVLPGESAASQKRPAEVARGPASTRLLRDFVDSESPTDWDRLYCPCLLLSPEEFGDHAISVQDTGTRETSASSKCGSGIGTWAERPSCLSRTTMANGALHDVIKKARISCLKKLANLSRSYFHAVQSHLSGEGAGSFLNRVGQGTRVLDFGRMLHKCLTNANMRHGPPTTLCWRGCIRSPHSGPRERLRVISADFDAHFGVIHVLVRGCPRLVPRHGSGGVGGDLHDILWRDFVLSASAVPGQEALVSVVELDETHGNAGSVRSCGGGFAIEADDSISVYSSATLRSVASYDCRELRWKLGSPEPEPHSPPLQEASAATSRVSGDRLPFLSQESMHEAPGGAFLPRDDDDRALMQYNDGHLLVVERGLPPYVLHQIYGRSTSGAAWYDMRSGSASSGSQELPEVASVQSSRGLTISRSGLVCRCDSSQEDTLFSVLADAGRPGAMAVCSSISGDVLAILYDDMVLGVLQLREVTSDPRREPSGEPSGETLTTLNLTQSPARERRFARLLAVRTPSESGALFIVQMGGKRVKDDDRSAWELTLVHILPSGESRVVFRDLRGSDLSWESSGSIDDEAGFQQAYHCQPHNEGISLDGIRPYSDSSRFGANVSSNLHSLHSDEDYTAVSFLERLVASGTPKQQDRQNVSQKLYGVSGTMTNQSEGQNRAPARHLVCAWLEPLTGSIILWFSSGERVAIQIRRGHTPSLALQLSGTGLPEPPHPADTESTAASCPADDDSGGCRNGLASSCQNPRHASPQPPPVCPFTLQGSGRVQAVVQLPGASLLISPSGEGSLVSTGPSFWG